MGVALQPLGLMHIRCWAINYLLLCSYNRGCGAATECDNGDLSHMHMDCHGQWQSHSLIETGLMHGQVCSRS